MAQARFKEAEDTLVNLNEELEKNYITLRTFSNRSSKTFIGSSMIDDLVHKNLHSETEEQLLKKDFETN